MVCNSSLQVQLNGEGLWVTSGVEDTYEVHIEQRLSPEGRQLYLKVWAHIWQAVIMLWYVA